MKIWHAQNLSQQGKQHFGVGTGKSTSANLADAAPLAKAVRCYDNPKQPCVAGRL